MFQHELAMASPICPDCGSSLHRDNGALHCDAHGSFFIYGPHLLVRCAPASQDQPILTLLPWQRVAEYDASPASQRAPSSL